MNATNKQQDKKMSYEPICLKVAEVKPQGVLCASSGQSDANSTESMTGDNYGW